MIKLPKPNSPSNTYRIELDGQTVKVRFVFDEYTGNWLFNCSTREPDRPIISGAAIKPLIPIRPKVFNSGFRGVFVPIVERYTSDPYEALYRGFTNVWWLSEDDYELYREMVVEHIGFGQFDISAAIKPPDPPFEPIQLNPAVFLDSHSLETMFIDHEGTQPVRFEGDPVGLIVDRYNGTRFTSPISSQRGLYVGQNGIRFESNAKLESNLGTSENVTAYMVATMDGNRRGRFMAGSGSAPYFTNGQETWAFSGTTSGSRVFWRNPKGTPQGGMLDLHQVYGARYMTEAVITRDEIQQRVGDLHGSSEISGPIVSSPIQMWNPGNESPFSIELFIVFNRILLESDREKMRNWIKAKYID